MTRKIVISTCLFVMAFLLPRGFSADISAVSTKAVSRFGIEGGYFTCALPGSWEYKTDDAPQDRISELLLLGPRAENAPVMIFVYYYGEGNPDFKDPADFVTRNTTDLWDDKPLAEAKKIELHGMEALTFDREEKSFLNPESKSDASVILKNKFYVVSGKDRKGFFVLHYTAPKSVYDEHLPVFQKVVDSFQLV